MAVFDSKPYGIIYCITNKANGKRYIGQTTRTLQERLKGHFYSKGRNGCRLLSAAIAKYGRQSFSAEVLASASSQVELDELEVDQIKRFDTTDRLIGYNIAVGGGGGKQAPETIALRVSKTRGKKRTDEFRLMVSNTHKGAKRSEETRARISQGARNRPPVSEETRQKLREASTGRKWTEARRMKIAEHATGKTHSEETRRKLSAIVSGTKRDPEAVRKTAAANTGKKRSPEVCKKISEARKAYWAAKREALSSK